MKPRKPYPTDISDEEWAFAAPYLTLMDAQALQRKYALRAIFNALRRIASAGATWRLLSNDFPRWEAVYQQTQRWLRTGCLKPWSAICALLRVAPDKKGQPSAVIFDGRTLQSTCESGQCAGYDGYKRKKGSKVHMAVDTLGHLLAVQVTPANEQERAQVRSLAQEVQHVTGETVKIAFVDQGYTGQEPAQAAKEEGVELHVIKLQEAKKGFVLLPRRWVVGRSFGWVNRFRRLALDYERLPEALDGLHFFVFTILMLGNAATLFQIS
ncbi:IS5 family transposase [Xanthomonas hortorum]|uniref:IS5 family transposase n=1 Tax=Xanthomonas hortorum TaxID=56454 RepID=UPI002935BB34|nr:IS5 family transposase [Xanthomonas hortorum]MDV2453241.1 IS5 family transposase [Xanthomonas hortorum NBC5720]